MMLFSVLSSISISGSEVSAEEAEVVTGLNVTGVTDSTVSLSWTNYEGADEYVIYWADKNVENVQYQKVATVTDAAYTFEMSTHIPHYFKVAAVVGDTEEAVSTTVKSETKKEFTIQLEDLDRGLLATTTSEGVFLSWRLLSDEVTGYSDYGQRGTDFNVYRDGELLDTVETSTNYLDTDGTGASEYYVTAVVDGEETSDVSDTAMPWEDSYYDLELQTPADGVTPAGDSYTYSANDMSVGDVTGDGKYEFIVKWDPSNSKDVSQVGYTGNTYIDTYKFDGTLLHRMDLGVNIRSGAHYTQFLVYDFDGNGKAEIMFKTAPGTKVMNFDGNGEIESEEYITMPDEDIDAGYSNEDDYRKNADDYYDHLVNVFMNWHEHEEVTAGNWPETLEEALGTDVEYDYPLSREDAESLVDYFMDVYAPSRSSNNDLRNFEGFILDGPEYLTIFNGETGAELETIKYEPARGDDGLMWGDYAYSRIEPGNRVDRFNAGVAYLDGENPSAVFNRGYYTRATFAAYDWDGENLQEVWVADSGHVPMNNPFNDTPHGAAGSIEDFARLAGQGNHQISTADVDGDGKHEIIHGGATLDHDGTLLYSSMADLPEGSGAPGENVIFGHGDALHVSDINPDRPGLEIWSVFEASAWAPYGKALRDAATGEVIHGEYTGNDEGRGMIGDVVRGERGLETWNRNLKAADGKVISSNTPGTNMNIKWDSDMTTQLINGSGNATPTIDDWENGRLLTADGTRTNNGTKGNPSLVADVFGDWREELLVRTEDSSAIRIYTNTEVTDRKMYTLMHDIQYRTGIAWQNGSYNQPAYPSFYFASDIDWDFVPVPNYSGELEYIEEEGPEIDVSDIEDLIAAAKEISNENNSYTEMSYQTLQEAITEAEEELEQIIYQYQVSSVVRNLQVAMDGLEEIVDLGPGWRFDFGSSTSPLANGYTKITDDTVYDEETGYGFAEAADGNRDQGEPDDLRRDFILANGSELMVDVPDGEYDVKIITGAQTDSNDTTFSLEHEDTQGGTRTEAGEFAEYKDTIAVSDGQLNIVFTGSWARVNGIEIVAVEDFNVKFDFGSKGSPTAYGYEQVANSLLYDSEKGFGLNKAVAERDRGGPDDVRRDFVIDGDYEFTVDLRDGDYLLHIIAGDNIASNTSTFSVDGESIGSIASGSGEFGELTEQVTVTDGQLTLNIGERINGLEIYYVPEDEESVDVKELEGLIEEAKAISNEEKTFTDSSYASLLEAIEAAEAALEAITTEEQLQVEIASLQKAMDELEEVPEPEHPGKGHKDNPGKGPLNSPGKGPMDNPGKGPVNNPGKNKN